MCNHIFVKYIVGSGNKHLLIERENIRPHLSKKEFTQAKTLNNIIFYSIFVYFFINQTKRIITRAGLIKYLCVFYKKKLSMQNQFMPIAPVIYFS